MALSNNLISQFVKVTSDNNKSTKNEGTAYGTTVINNGITYVRLDGSEQLTPVSTTANIKPDERVMVKIKNHSATIVGNLTSPAARIGDVNDLQNDVNVKFDTTNEAIEAEVSRSTEAEGELASRIKVTEDAISTEVTARQNADNEMSTKISQTAHSISISASGSGNTAGITIALYDENGKLIGDSKTANITITGFVTFNDLGATGSTNIDGARITTGSISCDRLNGGTIKGQNIVGGTTAAETMICYDKFYMSPSMFSDLNQALGYKKEAFKMDVFGCLHFINKIYVPTIESPQIINSDAFDANGGITYGIQISSNGNLIPVTAKTVYVGTNPNPFAGGYSQNGWAKVSDIRLKKDLISLKNDNRFEGMFYLLKPILYRLTNDDKVAHIGFGAQHVKEAMDLCDIREDEFYGFHHEYVDRSDFDTDEQYQKFLERNEGNPDTYSLCYEEFIALNTHMIQKQHKEIELLKQENLALQNKLSILEQRMEELENVISKQNN